MARTPKPDATPVAVTPAEGPASKGRPTPSRKQQEAARQRPLVPSDRRLAARQSREQVAEQRDRARIGQARGEEKYLQPRDKGPQKRFVRDFVDARFSVAEVLIPFLAVAIVISLVPAIAAYAFIVLYGLMIIIVADGLYLGAQVRRALAQKFGGTDRVEKGVRLYAFMRAIQLRPMRLPKPQVKRGQTPS